MKLSTSALHLAVAKFLPPAVAAGFASALVDRSDEPMGDLVALPMAAAALLLGLVPGASAGVENLPLRCAVLSYKVSVITLDPADAVMHPLLRDWAPLTLGGAVEQVILAGAALTAIAPGAPNFESVAIRDIEGLGLAAAAALSFRPPVEARIQLFYGLPPVTSAFTTTHEVTGDALFAIGMAAVTAPAASHALEQDNLINGAAQAAFTGAYVEAQAAAGTVH